MLNINDLSKPEIPNRSNYEQALKVAFEIFDRKDPGRLTDKSGAELIGRSVIVPHLNRSISLNLDTHHIAIRETAEEAPIWIQILLLHYINNADGRHPTGKLKHFREFKEGQFYEPAFNRGTKEVLIQVFGSKPEMMKQAGLHLNAKIVGNADVGLELKYFPFLPITCLLWLGDDDFPAEASVLFDETAELFFSAEDMAVAGQMAVLELVRASND